MLVFKELRDDVNFIHVIMGYESEFQFNMAGNIMVEINDLIDSTRKNVLYMNKCDSEEELQNQINYVAGNSNQVIEDNNVKTPVSTGTESSNTNYKSDIKCPSCGAMGCYIEKGELMACKTCMVIDNGLENKDIPAPPEKEQFDTIIKNFFKNKKGKKDNE
jgi:DNA-directed RNA polymerase subunit M/transcription elongation factor TFIIS